jgi:hypothetical protein
MQTASALHQTMRRKALRDGRLHDTAPFAKPFCHGSARRVTEPSATSRDAGAEETLTARAFAVQCPREQRSARLAEGGGPFWPVPLFPLRRHPMATLELLAGAARAHVVAANLFADAHRFARVAFVAIRVDLARTVAAGGRP